MTYKTFRITKYVSLIIIGFITFGFFYAAPSPKDRILNIQNYLITVSGIISGIVIAYLSAKLFSIKQERDLRQNEINNLSDKLTSYRRILYCVMHSHDYWKDFSEIRKFKEDYPGATFETFHNPEAKRNELKSRVYQELGDIPTRPDLFLAMEAIYDDDGLDIGGTWVDDRTLSFNYSLDFLRSLSMPSNQIWYYLDFKHWKHTEGLINDTSVWNIYKERIREYFFQIDNKYRSRDFDRHLLADVANEFCAYYLPKLINLTEINEAPLPKLVQKTFWNLVLVFIGGVTFPLFIQCLNLLDRWNIILTLGIVGIVIVCFFNFLFDFYIIMNLEVRHSAIHKNKRLL